MAGNSLEQVTQSSPAGGAPVRHAAAATPHAAGQEPGPISSAALLKGSKTVTIEHNGEFYRLQATRQGKLILTK